MNQIFIIQFQCENGSRNYSNGRYEYNWTDWWQKTSSWKAEIVMTSAAFQQSWTLKEVEEKLKDQFEQQQKSRF